MEVAVTTTGDIRRAKLQSKCRHQQSNTQFFTSWMPFLSPNQQCQSTEGKYIPKCINQSINQSTNQPTNQPIHPSIHPSIHQSISPSVSQSISQSINQSIYNAP